MRLIQISAGRGPLECSWVVGKVMMRLCKEAESLGLRVSFMTKEEDEQPDCFKSVILSIEGEGDSDFLNGWLGTIKWIAASPFRPNHKRKNWFVSVSELSGEVMTDFDLTAVRFETMRSSGAGGQHVNKTESAVRVTHVETGVSVVVSAERSQYRNKSVALRILAEKLQAIQDTKVAARQHSNWLQHSALERGNPIRILR